MRKLSPKTVEEIYFFTGTAKEIYNKFGCSVRVAKRIKFGETYTEITENFDNAGEVVIHNLAWDDICEIRCSSIPAKNLASIYGVSKETIYNILNNKTRRFS